MLYFNDEEFLKKFAEDNRMYPISYQVELSSHLYNAVTRLETLNLTEPEWVKLNKIAIAITHIKAAEKIIRLLSYDNTEFEKQLWTEKKGT